MEFRWNTIWLDSFRHAYASSSTRQAENERTNEQVNIFRYILMLTKHSNEMERGWKMQIMN